MTHKTKKWLKIISSIIAIMAIILFLSFKTDRGVEGLNNYKTEHFSIYYATLKQSTLLDMEKALEKNYNKSNAFFNIQNPKTINVVIYNDVNEFQKKAYGLFISFILQDWAVGAAIQDALYMTSPENPDKTHDYMAMLEVLVHEYTHVQVWRVKEFPDIWLDEGLAVYFADQKSNISTAMPTFVQMQLQGLNDFVNAEGYTFGYYYIEFLLANYKPQQIIKLLKTNDYQVSLGANKREIYNKWKEELER
ncbi:MAG: hypothetical protein OCD03_16160 [Hyphomicrobiales bacterium]